MGAGGGRGTVALPPPSPPPRKGLLPALGTSALPSLEIMGGELVFGGDSA